MRTYLKSLKTIISIPHIWTGWWNNLLLRSGLKDPATRAQNYHMPLIIMVGIFLAFVVWNFDIRLPFIYFSVAIGLLGLALALIEMIFG
jgi:hypothetical protein